VCIGANGTTARAQPGDVPEPPQKNAFRPGLWSLQFAIANNFTLSSFQGSSLSCKRHFSERVALRAGVSLTGSYVDQGATERNEQNIGLNAQYLIYPNPTGKVRLYYGAGPELALSRSKAEQSSGTSGSSTTTTRWSLGAGCVLGGEWFVVDGVSLLAEYGSAFTFDDTRVKYVSGSSTSESKTRSIALSAKSVRFGLSLYF
jgi:opacity protein-like surface antigen